MAFHRADLKRGDRIRIMSGSKVNTRCRILASQDRGDTLTLQNLDVARTAPFKIQRVPCDSPAPVWKYLLSDGHGGEDVWKAGPRLSVLRLRRLKPAAARS